MRRLATILALFGAIIAWRAAKTGELGIIDSLVAARNANRPFDSAAWRSGNLAVRGQMLGDLARNHRFKGMDASSVRDLLGPSECYVDYDDEPCYRIQFGATKSRLAFSVNHSDQPGKILSVGIED